MDMREPLAYLEECRGYAKAMVKKIDSDIMKLQSQRDVYSEMEMKLDIALDKERRKAAGEIEY